MSKPGSLAVIGTGMMMGGDLTLAAKAWIEKSDVLLYHVVDPPTAQWIRSMNADAQPLLLPKTARRAEGYQQMAQEVVAHVQPGKTVCALFYGHPMVLTDPTAAIKTLAHRNQIPFKIFPGISSLDAMMADLGIDMFKQGCQVMEATDLLIRRRIPDHSMHVVLLQPAMIGNLAGFEPKRAAHGLTLLQEYLGDFYEPGHNITVYAAAFNAANKAWVQHLKLADLPGLKPVEYMSLYLQPAHQAPLDPSMTAALGLEKTVQTNIKKNRSRT